MPPMAMLRISVHLYLSCVDFSFEAAKGLCYIIIILHQYSRKDKNRSTLPPLLPPGLQPPGYGQVCAVAFLCSP